MARIKVALEDRVSIDEAYRKWRRALQPQGSIIYQVPTPVETFDGYLVYEFEEPFLFELKRLKIWFSN